MNTSRACHTSHTVGTVEHADVVIVGGGAAGMSAALALAGKSVRLLTPTAPGSDGASAMAQGGVAAALGSADSPALHAADTLAVGGGINVPDVVRLLASAAPEQIERLITLGARFDRDAEGALELGREAAHGHPRIVHADGDATGAEISRALGQAVMAAEHVVVERAIAHELITRQGRVCGVIACREDGSWVAHLADAVVLCTGGIGRIYRETTNPSSSRGEGLALAAAAGARLLDLEFVQFHPTALAVDEDPLPLLTEALRGAGATLVDGSGQRFMPAFDRRAELAPRDTVTRAIFQLLEDGEQVFLDARQAIGAEFPERFPTVFEICRRHGLDPRRELLPVRPAAHYHMGGVATDADGRTSLAGLWAAGEVACTGAHGANRLASNSLLECLVLGSRVAADLERATSKQSATLLDAARLAVSSRGPRRRALEQQVRALMSSQVGVVRDAVGLHAAINRLEALRPAMETAALETRSVWTVARLIARAALERRESRGSHARRDFPQAAASGPYRLALVQSSGDGSIEVETLAVESAGKTELRAAR